MHRESLKIVHTLLCSDRARAHLRVARIFMLGSPQMSMRRSTPFPVPEADVYKAIGSEYKRVQMA